MKASKNMIITSEQVGKGHPDKICDQVSDYILTKILKQDKDARVAVESAIGKGKLFITGEVTTSFDYQIGLQEEIKSLLVDIDIDYNDFEIELNISKQSPEINSKVDAEEIGAGDQGLMFGYATSETKSMLPIPFDLSNQLIKAYENKLASQSEDFKFDSKAQVCYDYTNKRLVNINMSVQHSKDISLEDLRTKLTTLINEVVSEFEKENDFSIMDSNTELIINNAGSFILGGAIADSGLTGRKIIADTYGGLGRHGGGAFSGKDYTKVDRSAAYYARFVAKSIIKRGLADIAEIQVSYIIGQTHPVSIFIETFGTNISTLDEIMDFVNENFDFRLGNIIAELDLKNIDYTKTTLYGHFSKNDLPWE